MVALARQDSDGRDGPALADCASLCCDEPLLRSAAERAQARCRNLSSYFSNNIDALIDDGARYR